MENTNDFFKSIDLVKVDRIKSLEFDDVEDDTYITNYFSADYEGKSRLNLMWTPLDVQVLFVCSYESAGIAKYEAREVEVLRNKNNRITVSNSKCSTAWI